MSRVVFLMLHAKAPPLSLILCLVSFFMQGGMEWPGDFPDDHAFVELMVPGLSSEMDFDQFLKDTEEKLNLNANRSVRVKGIVVASFL